MCERWGIACVLVACGCAAEHTTNTTGAPSCGEPGKDLTGGAYDIARSRFAFGSTPVLSHENGMSRYVGANGVVAITTLGYELGLSNATSPAQGRPDWSADTGALTAHVLEYFGAMGMAACQATPQILASGGGGGAVGQPSTTVFYGRTVAFNRVAAGIPVVESIAHAKMNDQDQTTEEGFFWPTLPASAIDEARAFRDRLADTANLDAYKAKLPPESRGPGQVVIHHTEGSPGTTTELKVVVAWDTMSGRSPRSYDTNGVELPYGSW